MLSACADLLPDLGGALADGLRRLEADAIPGWLGGTPYEPLDIPLLVAAGFRGTGSLHLHTTLSLPTIPPRSAVLCLLPSLLAAAARSADLWRPGATDAIASDQRRVSLDAASPTALISHTRRSTAGNSSSLRRDRRRCCSTHGMRPTFAAAALSTTWPSRAVMTTRVRTAPLLRVETST